MNIISYSQEQILEGLQRSRKKHDDVNDHIKLIFTPIQINHDNFERVCDIYSRINPLNYETVVIIETFEKQLDKKLPMPSNRYFKTSFGKVPVNDYLRNELCDEDDDFFIHDEGFSKNMSLFQQLPLLQSVFKEDDFNVLSIQIADRGPSIVKELAHTLEVVLAPQNALLIFCCELDNERKNEFEKVVNLIETDDQSGLMNYLNSGDSKIKGTPSFISGVLVANAWELDLNFLKGQYDEYSGSLITAYADRQKVLF